MILFRSFIHLQVLACWSLRNPHTNEYLKKTFTQKFLFYTNGAGFVDKLSSYQNHIKCWSVELKRCCWKLKGSFVFIHTATSTYIYIQISVSTSQDSVLQTNTARYQPYPNQYRFCSPLRTAITNMWCALYYYIILLCWAIISCTTQLQQVLYNHKYKGQTPLQSSPRHWPKVINYTLEFKHPKMFWNSKTQSHLLCL